jgi:tetratricopeptide (TPR) repeat protein
LYKLGGDALQDSSPTRVAWFAAAAAVIATLLVMGVWNIRLAWADYRFRQETLPGTQAALRLEPDGADYYVRLAAMIQASNPAASRQALERAVALNPRDAQSWIELGLRAEAAGDLAGAERRLLRAASVDKQYLPSWSLANFYFRRGDAEKFWFWARAAMGMAYGDQAPLFALCWKLTDDGALIAQELDIRKADPEANYLAYLTSQNRIEPMPEAAMRLLAWDRGSDAPLLLAACDRLIADDRAGEAIRIWNKLAELHRIPYSVLAPASGTSLTDGGFTILPTSQGFDWRLPSVDGVTTLLDERPAGLRISFSGRQPEDCDVLTQILPVAESSNYEFRFLYRTSGIDPGTGLAWRITDLNGAKILAQGESLASESETEGRLPFKTPAGSGLERLTLTYQRALGTTRIEGFVDLRKLRLTQAQLPSHDTPQVRPAARTQPFQGGKQLLRPSGSGRGYSMAVVKTTSTQ